MPRCGIDTDARWGFARTKGWVFGYKLHVSYSAGKMVCRCLLMTAANVPDNLVCQGLIENMSGTQNKEKHIS